MRNASQVSSDRACVSSGKSACIANSSTGSASSPGHVEIVVLRHLELPARMRQRLGEGAADVDRDVVDDGSVVSEHGLTCDVDRWLAGDRVVVGVGDEPLEHRDLRRDAACGDDALVVDRVVDARHTARGTAVGGLDPVPDEMAGSDPGNRRRIGVARQERHDHALFVGEVAPVLQRGVREIGDRGGDHDALVGRRHRWVGDDVGDPWPEPAAGDAVGGACGVACRRGRCRPVEGVVVVERRVDQLERRAEFVGRDRPRRPIVIRDGVDDHGRRVAQRDRLAAVRQVAAVLGSGSEPVRRVEASGILGDHEPLTGPDSGSGREHEVDAAEAPPAEVDRVESGVGELEEVVAVEIGDRVVHDLADHHVAVGAVDRRRTGHHDDHAGDRHERDERRPQTLRKPTDRGPSTIPEGTYMTVHGLPPFRAVQRQLSRCQPRRSSRFRQALPTGSARRRCLTTEGEQTRGGCALTAFGLDARRNRRRAAPSNAGPLQRPRRSVTAGARIFSGEGNRPRSVLSVAGRAASGQLGQRCRTAVSRSGRRVRSRSGRRGHRARRSSRRHPSRPPGSWLLPVWCGSTSGRRSSSSS